MNALRNTAILTLVICSLTIAGQDNKSVIGLETGPGIRSIRGNEFIDDYKILAGGFSGGLSYQYNFTKRVSFRTNLSYELKGFSVKLQTTDDEGRMLGESVTRYNLNYLSIPLLGRFTLGKRNSFFINVGPYVGYLLYAKSVYDAIGDFPKTKYDITEAYKRFDVGLSSGIGINLPIKDKLIFSAEIRNNLGLVNTNAAEFPNESDMKTISTNILFGIAYRLGGRGE